MLGIESYPLRRYLLDQARGRICQKVNFIYEARPQADPGVSVAVAASVNIDTDSDFEWRGTLGRIASNNPSGGGYVPGGIGGGSPGNGWGNDLVHVTIRIGGADGRAWSNSKPLIEGTVPTDENDGDSWSNVTGMRPIPAMFATPLVIPAGSAIHATISSVFSGGINGRGDVFILQYVGAKLYSWRGRR